MKTETEKGWCMVTVWNTNDRERGKGEKAHQEVKEEQVETFSLPHTRSLMLQLHVH